MNYYLYKFSFTTALHIGNDFGRDNLSSSEYTIHSDTIFSALFIEAVHYGDQYAARLKCLFENGAAVLSDAFPFCGEEYFLPRPVYRIPSEQSVADPEDRKLFKKLSYIPLSMFQEYLHVSKARFDIRKAIDIQKNMVFEDKRQRVAIAGQKETQPYFVGNILFNDGCGLYMILGVENETDKSMLDRLLSSLSYSGIGGKRSTGFGKFELKKPVDIADSGQPAIQKLYGFMTNRHANFYMTLNTSLPDEQEMSQALDGANFVLCRRGGFIQSSGYSKKQLKKRTVYALSAGACLKNTYSGVFCNLADGGNHPVFRCLIPLFAGVTL